MKDEPVRVTYPPPHPLPSASNLSLFPKRLNTMVPVTRSKDSTGPTKEEKGHKNRGVCRICWSWLQGGYLNTLTGQNGGRGNFQ